MVGDANGLSDPDKCVKWSPAAGSKMISMNFGSGSQKMDAVRFFSDDNCQHSNQANDYFHEDQYTMGSAPQETDISCIKNKGPYKSLKMFYDPEWKNQFWSP